MLAGKLYEHLYEYNNPFFVTVPLRTTYPARYEVWLPTVSE